MTLNIISNKVKISLNCFNLLSVTKIFMFHDPVYMHTTKLVKNKFQEELFDCG